MNEQHNPGAHSVTQTGHIYNQYGTQAQVPLAGARWVNRTYPFGKGVRPEVWKLYIVLVLMIVVVMYGWLFSPFSWPAIRKFLGGWLDLAVILTVVGSLLVGARIGAIMERLERFGFSVNGPLQGYIKDEQGFVAHVPLTGEGTVCAQTKCRGRLRFVSIQKKPYLQ